MTHKKIVQPYSIFLFFVFVLVISNTWVTAGNILTENKKDTLRRATSNLKSQTGTTNTWRSSLYPKNWKPGYQDSRGRFLHDFSYAGYQQGEKNIPEVQDNIVDVTKPPYNANNKGDTDVTATIQSALDEVGSSGGGVVFLPAGSYQINPGNSEYALRIKHDNTLLRGAGIDSTFIFNDTPNMRGKDIILMMGDRSNWGDKYGSVSHLTIDLMHPTRIIPVESANGFKKGEYVILRSGGTEAFAEEHGMGGIWTSWATRVMFLRKIDSIDVENSLIYIDSPTRYFMKKRDNARVYHAKDHISECGIENLSIGNRQSNKDGWGEEAYQESGTGAYDVHASHAIQLKYAQNCWVKNVNTYKPETNSGDFHVLSNCLLLSQCRNVTVDSCFFQKPQYEGGGGNGYMFTLSSNDCLIKNSRANHSRHNYDFKMPYSNGNVIHNCIAENSKYSSDFHMYLSMANLFDVTTIDKDYLESTFRPWGGNVIHGYSSTQSVFYNTKGVAYHPNKNYIVDSRQFGYGYIIGTSGAATNVKLDPVSGTTNGYKFNTSPRDFLEGEGEGTTLEPQSLYLDQLQRRLNDSNGIPTYNVSVIIKHKFTGEPLINGNVKVLNVQDSTDAEGKAQFANVQGLFSLYIEKENFYPLETEQLSIYSDTTFTFQLVPKEYNVTIVVKDKATGETFWGVPVEFNNTSDVTNENGEVNFLAYEGEFSYFIEKSSYRNESGTVKVQSDTTFHFYLTRTDAYIKFRLREGTTPVNDAAVVLNSDTLISTRLGLATFRELPVMEEYSFKIYKNGYNDMSGNLFLQQDTTIQVSMDPYPVAAGIKKTGELKIWPNPASESIHFQLPRDFIYGIIEILNINGFCLQSISIKNSTFYSINLDEFSSGMYFLKITSGEKHLGQWFLKK